MGDTEWKKMRRHTAHAVEKIFEGIDLLREAHPKRNFTIDGKLVGDIGEAIAEDVYNIELTEKSEKFYDATFRMSDKKKKVEQLQIKATFKKEFSEDTEGGLGFSKSYRSMYYLGLQLTRNGEYREVYNGRGNTIYNFIYNKPKRPKSLEKGQLVGVSIKKLMELSKQEEEDKVPAKK